MLPNEEKLKTLEKEKADALEMAAQENEEREEKEAGQGLVFYFLQSLEPVSSLFELL